VNPIRTIVLGGFVVFAAGCATTNTVSQLDNLTSERQDPTVLLMPPDVKYYLWTAGGVKEPHADWTAAARRNFRDAVMAYAAEHAVDVVALDPAAASDPTIQRYEKLHRAVGRTIQFNHFGTAKLPTKAGEFDWGLGPGVSEIGRAYGADYALFSFYRDYQASGGRIAFAVLAAAAGVGVPATAEFGFASLVDLRTGDVVWFNKVDVGAGELRDREGARTVVDGLFRDMPEG
jgi:hypothetical protein